MHPRTRVAVVTAAALLVVAVPACGRLLPTARDHAHRLVDATTFLRLVQQRPSTTSHVSFVGTDGDRAYLTHWRMGVLGGESHDVVSVVIDELPVAERTALREGRDPWWQRVTTNDPGLLPAESAALAGTARLPARSPIVVAMRCARGEAPRVARDHFDAVFTDDTVLPVPVPCTLVLLVTADERSTLLAGGVEPPRSIDAGETVAERLHLAAAGDTDVVVRGASTQWRVCLRGVPAATFFAAGFDQRRTK